MGFSSILRNFHHDPPTLHARGQEDVHAWAIFTYLDNFRLFELSEDVYARSVPLVLSFYGEIESLCGRDFVTVLPTIALQAPLDRAH